MLKTPKAPFRYPSHPDQHLLRAVQRNDLGAVNEALSRGGAVNLRYERGVGETRPLLIAAVECAGLPLIDRLLVLGANPNASASEGETATSTAWFSKQQLLPLLRRYGGDLEQAYLHGGSGQGVLYRTLEGMEQQLRNDPGLEKETDSWFHTGGDLPALIALNPRWDRHDAFGVTPEQVLHDWFPRAFIDRVMGWRAAHEQTLLRAVLQDDPAMNDLPGLGRRRL